MPKKIRREDPTPRDFKDRRAFPRVRKSGTALMRPADNSQAPGVGVVLGDVSHGGTSFTVDVKLKVGEQIVLVIRSEAGGAKVYELKAKIRWIAANQVSGIDTVGCEWLEPLSLNDLLRLV